MARHLDEQVAAFRNRLLDAGPDAFVRVDALTQKVREGGRIINVHALIAVGVNADGHRGPGRTSRRVDRLPSRHLSEGSMDSLCTGVPPTTPNEPDT